jgi:hypothetical protein
LVSQQHFIVKTHLIVVKDICFFSHKSRLDHILLVTNLFGGITLELAKEGVPLPGGNHFWASNWPGKSPLPGLIIHAIPSVSLS